MKRSFAPALVFALIFALAPICVAGRTECRIRCWEAFHACQASHDGCLMVGPPHEHEECAGALAGCEAECAAAEPLAAAAAGVGGPDICFVEVPTEEGRRLWIAPDWVVGVTDAGDAAQLHVAGERRPIGVAVAADELGERLAGCER